METISANPTQQRTHPLILAAAGSVLVLSLTAAASIAGWLPTGHKAEAASAAVVTPTTAVTTQAEAPKPVAPQVVVVNTPAPVIARAARAAPAHRSSKVSAGDTAPATTAVAKTTPAVLRDPPTRDLEVIDATPPVRQAPIQFAEACRECGVIESINEIPVEASGKTGAIAGGIVGAILGNQIGKGSSRDIATIVGAAGGAYAGHQIEKTTNKQVRYEVVVRFEDGTVQRIDSATRPNWRVGEKVRLQNGELAQRS